jgi:hypothetical protein
MDAVADGVSPGSGAEVPRGGDGSRPHGWLPAQYCVSRGRWRKSWDLPPGENRFYPATMPHPDIDRTIANRIAEAARRTPSRQLTVGEEAAAIDELRLAAAGRADLLGEHAGVALGFGEGRADSARYRQIAELCIAAGADRALMERWVTVARLRAAITMNWMG